MNTQKDFEGNIWHNLDAWTNKKNHGTRGAHASVPFQCEDCWMINLERRLPIPGRDDAYVMFIRRANLDAIVSREKSTLEGHAARILQRVRNCVLIGKSPSIEPRDPMPIADSVGMGVAVELLLHSVTFKPRIKGQKFVQFDSVRTTRTSSTNVAVLSSWNIGRIRIQRRFR